MVERGDTGSPGTVGLQKYSEHSAPEPSQYRHFQGDKKGMAAQGHHHAALECMTKTIALHCNYKRAVQHNSISGNVCYRCHLYEELHCIYYRGNASIHPNRINNSFSLKNIKMSPTSIKMNPEINCTPAESPEELCTLKLGAVDVAEKAKREPSDMNGRFQFIDCP